MRGYGYGYEDERDWYDLQQVCVTGHIVTNYAESKPDGRRERCAICGEATITACPSCNVRIRGYHHMPGVYYPSSQIPDKFCDSCGAAMPWVEREIQSIMEICGLSEGLSEADLEGLRDISKALTTASSQTEIAALRLRKIAAKMDDFEQAALMRALKASATEPAKVALGLAEDSPAARKKR
ncbi:DUF2321 domain-containing protein [Sphingomonas rubra]|uniref:DUF2321 domain-containing protein n=1 Tax=Sphingomonas rubra TaxID=634430 RepID=UPI000B85F1B9|nr:DUF2321 domain-containing protein [Sphingomonas rubra]